MTESEAETSRKALLRRVARLEMESERLKAAHAQLDKLRREAMTILRESREVERNGGRPATPPDSMEQQ